MTKLIYDYWFLQFDFPDENGNPYKSSGGKMVYNDDLKEGYLYGTEYNPNRIIRIELEIMPNIRSLILNPLKCPKDVRIQVK